MNGCSFENGFAKLVVIVREWVVDVGNASSWELNKGGLLIMITE